MSDPKTIKKAFERSEQALKKRPSLGQKTSKVNVRSNEGLLCEIEAGNWKFKSDMAKQVGGTGTAPPPGIYEAAALGSCITIMTKMWAAKMDVPINSIETEVEFDVDKRFLFNIGNVPVRWKAIRYNITVESLAPEREVMEVLDMAHRQSHVRGDFEYPFKVERNVKIKPTGEPTA